MEAGPWGMMEAVFSRNQQSSALLQKNVQQKMTTSIYINIVKNP
jgi:hypothetical protein